MHADHITGSGVLKGLIPGSQSLISKESNALADVFVTHGDIVEFGSHKIEVRSTPGHTNGIKILVHNMSLYIVIIFVVSLSFIFRLCNVCMS
jgi:sulfur dioxygenase